MNKHTEVTLQDVLDSKERRAEAQHSMRLKYSAQGDTLISMTVNMPGNRKYTDDTVQLIYFALHQLRLKVAEQGLQLSEEQIFHWNAGPVALVSVQGNAHQCKKLAIQIEQESPSGRLLDLDVFDADGNLISRDEYQLPRRICMVCERPAVECVRSRAHQPEEVRSAVKHLLLSFHSEQTKVVPDAVIQIASKALEAMLAEVACSPAPGLVDRFNAGAHQDMDFFTFIHSSSALVSSLLRCTLAGWTHSGDCTELLPVLRKIGLDGEKDMFAATNGVNTQKGLLFLLGITAAATALHIRKMGSSACIEGILQTVADMCQGLVAQELSPLEKNKPDRKLTAGERLFLEYGITGIRGELESGLTVLSAVALPRLEQAFSAGLSVNDAMVDTLIALIAVTPDTTILNRHNPQVLASVQQQAAGILHAGGMLTETGRQLIREWDDSLIQMNISPGGSADLLAAAYYFYSIKSYIRAFPGNRRG